MKVTRLKKTEVLELTPEEHQEEIKRMEAAKAKMTISFSPNGAEEKLAQKKRKPFVIRRVETVVIE